MSIAWKATMLPLHQRCSNENLLLYKEKQSSCFKNWLTIGEKKCRDKTLHQNNRQRITIASYGNRTHVNSLEGYYANTTPTMLTWTLVKIQGVTVLFCQKLIDDRREKVQRENAAPKQSPTDDNCIVRESNPCNSFEGYYATTTPTMLTWTFVIIQWETVLLRQKLFDNRTAKAQRENAALKQSPTDDNVSYGNGTHVKSLEGYYATTTPRMLTWKLVIIKWETVLLRQKLIDNRREKVQRENAAPKQSPTDHNCIVRESNPCQ